MPRPIPAGCTISFDGEAISLYFDALGDIDKIALTGLISKDGFRERNTLEFYKNPNVTVDPLGNRIPRQRKMPITDGELQDLKTLCSKVQDAWKLATDRIV